MLGIIAAKKPIFGRRLYCRAPATWHNTVCNDSIFVFQLCSHAELSVSSSMKSGTETPPSSLQAKIDKPGGRNGWSNAFLVHNIIVYSIVALAVWSIVYGHPQWEVMLFCFLSGCDTTGPIVNAHVSCRGQCRKGVIAYNWLWCGTS